MANINTQELFDQKVLAFGANAQSEAFQNAFMLALKLVSADVRIRAHQSFTTPGNWTADVEISEDYYLPVFSAGLDYYIQNHGDWMRKPEGNMYAVYQNAIKDANLYYMQGESTASTEARLGNLTD